MTDANRSGRAGNVYGEQSGAAARDVGDIANDLHILQEFEFVITALQVGTGRAAHIVNKEAITRGDNIGARTLFMDGEAVRRKGPIGDADDVSRLADIEDLETTKASRDISVWEVDEKIAG